MRKHRFLFAVTAAVLAFSMCGCKNTSGDTPAANLGETEEQTSSDAPYLTVVPTPSSVTINSEVAWGIGKTFDEITEKYGNVEKGNFNQYSFENGYGTYVWNGDGVDYPDNDVEKSISLTKGRGGCQMIVGIQAKDLLMGDLSTLNLDNFASKCGFEVVPLNPTPDGYGLYDGYKFAYYTHPFYENLTFIMSYKESGFDEDATFRICDDSVSNAESKPITKAEVEQIVACFKDWSYLDYGLHPDTHSGYFPECLDESQFITEEITRKGSIMTYTEDFYKVVSGDYATEDGFNQKLSEMFTEKFKERYMGSSSGAMFRFKDGETYVQGFGYGAYPDRVLDLDIYIDNFDGNSVEVTLAHDTDDGEERCSAVLVKGEDGNYRMDDGDLFDIPGLFHCKSANITVYQNNSVLLTL